MQADGVGPATERNGRMRRDTSMTPEPAPRAVEMRRRRRQPPIQISSSPAYDLLLSLHVTFGVAGGDYELDPTWAVRAQEKCDPALRQTLAFFFGDDEAEQWCGARLCALLWQAPVPAEISATIDWLAQIPVAEILTQLLDREGLGDDWREVATALIHAQTSPGETNADLSARIHTFAKRFPAHERAAVTTFLTEPEAERARLIEAIRAWHMLVFATEEPRISAIISREAARLEKRRTTVSGEDLFASVVRGIELDLPAATERLVLAPSVMIMPTIFHFRAGDTVTYCYPVADPSRAAADSETTQRHEMVRLFEALADDTRLRILRHLTTRQMYLTELSEHLKLTKATTRHHMIRLRAAGLVTLHVRDHLTYYSLNRETLDEPTRVLLRYLGV